MNVFVKTLGCKVNTFDSQVIENQFRARGYQLVSSAESADITVINTCSVTEEAEKEARYLLRRFKRENSKGIRVVTGCYAQINSQKLSDLSEVDFVVPNESKEKLVDLIEGRLAPDGRSLKESPTKFPEGVAPVLDNKQGHFKSALTLFADPLNEGRTRAFLKIQDGCDSFCAYCQIPYARGASRSVSSSEVMTQVEGLFRSGIPEVVFTGIHIGDYGRDLAEYDGVKQPFVEILRGIFKLPYPSKIRISSLEPVEATGDLFQLLAQHRDRVCDHFHLPLQSGSDEVLKRMRRKYSTEEYRNTVRMILSYFPHAQISADVIPGFPGETGQNFEETLSFIRECPIHMLHVFPYSKRPNTSALRMPNHLAKEVVTSRASILRTLSKELYRDFAKQFIGAHQEVLWEKKEKDGKVFGKTTNYMNVAAQIQPSRVSGRREQIKIKGFLDDQTLFAL